MKKMLCVLLSVLLLSLPVSAHSGRTDSAGGHHDNKNVSGLGPYHYHHGYPAHLHPNGVCPYASAPAAPAASAPAEASAPAAAAAPAVTGKTDAEKALFLDTYIALIQGRAPPSTTGSTAPTLTRPRALWPTTRRTPRRWVTPPARNATERAASRAAEKQPLTRLLFIFPIPAYGFFGAACQSGKGGSASGFTAMDMSRAGLSSAAIRFELSAPHARQRWMRAHSPSLRTQTPMGSIVPPQSDARSPGRLSTWTLDRQRGQWLRWRLPASSGVTRAPQTLQVKLSMQGSWR